MFLFNIVLLLSILSNGINKVQAQNEKGQIFFCLKTFLQKKSLLWLNGHGIWLGNGTHCTVVVMIPSTCTHPLNPN